MLLQRVEIADKDEAVIKGSRSELLKALAAIGGCKPIVTTGAGGLTWGWDGRDGTEDAYAFTVPI